jgi:glycosyltransferase involved in cell wall biosynthesis
MARALGVPLHEFCFSGARARRHFMALTRTVGLLLRRRPSVVFASNPSLVLTYVLLACRAIFRFRFASDAHYGGVVAVTGSAMIQRALDFANRAADVVIVTNPSHADRVRALGGAAVVCPDPLPELREDVQRPDAMNGAKKSVLFVCSFEIDEPFHAVFEAARTLVEQGFTVFVSGAYRRAGLSPEAIPQVRLLGFVDRPTYEGFLRHADVVLDFTTWEDCLVCGAYEAMAAGTPSVLSRTEAMTGLFTRGVVFSSHEPGEIARAVLTAYERRDELASEIPRWVSEHITATKDRAAAIRTAVGLAPAS